jgi:hypothetical protein
MSWTDDGGDHEGWASAEFPDGRVSTGGNAAGVTVQTPEDAISPAPGEQADTVDGRTAIGWRGMCTCGWLGPLWRRVPAEKAADPARHLVYWASPDRWDDGAPAAVKDAIREEWKAHLPSPEITGVKNAAAAARKADDALDDAVRRARQAGATWEAIGDAAGMTRQAAHGRWAGRWQPVATGGGQDQ